MAIGVAGPSEANGVIRTNENIITDTITISDFSTTFAADEAIDIIQVGTDNDFANGGTVYVTTTTTLPAGLAANTQYYCINITNNTMSLSLTSEGAAIDITTTGTGTHTIYRPMNGYSIGPVETANSANVTVPDGSVWTIE